jgi:hypothetical protein
MLFAGPSSTTSMEAGRAHLKANRADMKDIRAVPAASNFRTTNRSQELTTWRGHIENCQAAVPDALARTAFPWSANRPTKASSGT